MYERFQQIIVIMLRFESVIYKTNTRLAPVTRFHVLARHVSKVILRPPPH